MNSYDYSENDIVHHYDGCQRDNDSSAVVDAGDLLLLLIMGELPFSLLMEGLLLMRALP